MTDHKKTKRIFKKKDYYSGDGMMTAIWGPSMWHFLHTMSFNYPIKPTDDDKKNYKEFTEESLLQTAVTNIVTPFESIINQILKSCTL